VEENDHDTADDEYTLIPLGDDTFQIYKTSDLFLNHQVEVEREDARQSPVRETTETVLIGFSPRPTVNSADESRLDASATFPPLIPNDWTAPPTTTTAHLYDQLVEEDSSNYELPEAIPLSRPGKKRKMTKKKEEKKKETLIYACKICDITFNNEFSLDAHIQQHLIWKEGAEEMNRTSAEEEKQEEEGSKDEKDAKPNLIVLEGEYNSISGRGFFQCGICGKTFRNVGYIHIHLEKAHDVNADERIISQGRQAAAKTEAVKATAAAAAVDTITNAGTPAIEEDEKLDSSKSTNKLESSVSTNRVTHRCDDCHKTFDQLDPLLRHKVTHFRTFDCHFCGKNYTAKKSLQNHILTTHPQGYSRLTNSIDLTPREADETVT